MASTKAPTRTIMIPSPCRNLTCSPNIVIAAMIGTVLPTIVQMEATMLALPLNAVWKEVNDIRGDN